MNDKTIINLFVAHLRSIGYGDIKVERWPDVENRKTADIDAIAGPFAIEHTSIDTVLNQRERSTWFMMAIGNLENDEDITIPFRLNIAVEYGAITKGQKWDNIQEALKRWIVNESEQLKYGHTVTQIADGPLNLLVWKRKSRNAGVFFSRLEPNDHSLPERIRNLVDNRAKKLRGYQIGYKTLLLVETEDIALMNTCLLIDGISDAYPNGLPNGIDTVWYVDSSIPEDLQFMDLTSEIKQRSRASCSMTRAPE